MLVIIYHTQTNPEKRTVWTLAGKVFPDIKPENIIQLLSTSFETSYIQKLVGSKDKDWRGKEAQDIFFNLRDIFFDIPR